MPDPGGREAEIETVARDWREALEAIAEGRWNVGVPYGQNLSVRAFARKALDAARPPQGEDDEEAPRWTIYKRTGVWDDVIEGPDTGEEHDGGIEVVPARSPQSGDPDVRRWLNMRHA